MTQMKFGNRMTWLLYSIAVIGVALAFSGFWYGYNANRSADINARNSAATSKCLNQVLADRNGPGALDNKAAIAQAISQASAARLLLRIIAEPVGSPQATADIAQFRTDYPAYAQATLRWAATLQADQAVRNAHPLGKC